VQYLKDTHDVNLPRTPQNLLEEKTFVPYLSEHARKMKTDFFFREVPTTARILEIGSDEGWLKKSLTERGFQTYLNIDLFPPADIVGDIRKWREIGLQPNSFDIIVAFEVVEHVDIFNECYELLPDGGRLFLTTPYPHADWFLKILEFVGLTQKRTSPHSHLVYLKTIKRFENNKVINKFGLSQWAVMTKCSAQGGATQ
jgi:2-polyprenyl-3-methyl-5-hydroxy-6-metoxy-1,4-benzoquinol methylase